MKKTKSKRNRGAAVYHRVYGREGLEQSCRILFELIQSAAWHIGGPIYLYLDIDNHQIEEGGFDSEMYALQVDFIAGILLGDSQAITEAHLPLLPDKTLQLGKGRKQQRLPQDADLEVKQLPDGRFWFGIFHNPKRLPPRPLHEWTEKERRKLLGN